MEQYSVYKDIKARTGGEIYIGVVGPVRTGKSTFIKRFMELMVLPKMEDEHGRNQTRDELPQSAAGKMIMTTEPKFIPKEAAQIDLDDGISAKVRLIDCVGFMVDGASGHIENESERLVKTPWYDYEIPFTKAAEIGTRKVINDHSTIGIVVTTDGSIGELKRPNYLPAEERTVQELKNLGKPFIVLLNSAKPYSEVRRDRHAGELRAIEKRRHFPYSGAGSEGVSGDPDGLLYPEMAGNPAVHPLAEGFGDSGGEGCDGPGVPHEGHHGAAS